MENRQRILCPTWHSISLKDELRKLQYCFDLSSIPDHGGVGVDIAVENGQQKLFCPKSGKVQSYFGAEKYALPFSPPVKVKSSIEPCMEEIKKQRRKQETFCMKLWYTKQAIKRGKEKTSKMILDCYEKVNSLLENGKIDDISVPKAVYDTSVFLPDDYPAPIANWNYIGGCLDYFSSTDGDTFLLHPGGKRINKLTTTRMGVQKQRLNKSRSRFRLVEQDFLKLTGGLVYQIDAQRISGRDLCCVRKSHCCHVVSICPETPVKTEKVKKFWSEEQLSFAKLNPYVPGECLITTSSGKVHLYSVDSNDALWSMQEPLWEGSRWSTDFSSGPRLISVLDCHRLSHADLRSKSRKPLTLFTSSSPHLVLGEELNLAVKHPRQLSQCFLATTHHMLLCDHRYPNVPVQIWNHMLTSVPIHCSTSLLCNSEEIVVLLGAQESRETCCFQLQATENVQAVSLSPPWHLSTPSDFGQALRLQGVPVPTRRLMVPLTGACTVPHPSGGFTAFQTTSLGDLFYQDFLAKPPGGEKNFCFGPGCDLLPPQEILFNLDPWLVDDREETTPEQKMPQTMDCSKLKKDILKKKKPAQRCTICAPKEGRGVDKEICPSCGLHVDASLQLTTAKREGLILCGRVPGFSAEHNTIEEPKLSIPPAIDNLSKKLLKVWMEDDFMETEEIGENVDDVLRSILIPASQPNKRILEPEQEDDEIEFLYSTSFSKRRSMDANGF